MATYEGNDYTGFQAVNLKGTGGVRFGNNGNLTGKVALPNDDEGSRTWTLPAKSGTFPIMGTFRVQLPAASTSITQQSTIVTVSGIRLEDAIIVFPNKGTSAGYSFHNAGGTIRTLIASEAGNGNVTLTFSAAGTTAYTDMICSYLAAR